jgi:cytoskeletal protein CcmA (bactofilin family)
MDQKPPAAPEDKSEDLESLEAPSTVVEDSSSNAAQNTDVISAESGKTIDDVKVKEGFGKRLIGGLFGLNIYLLLFIFILFVAGMIVLFSYNYSKQKSEGGTVNTTTLNQETLDRLANSDATVGANGQVLNVQSSAVFAGKVLARSDLEVAGSLQLGGSLNLPNINVTDTANLGQVTVSQNLAVSGNAAVQGQQSITGALQVGGSGSFNGTVTAPQISTNNLQLNGNLVLTRHITAGGGTPGRSNGGALGGGGTSSAGSITINTGGGTSAGCFINVTFATRFDDTPHVIVTPVGSAAGSLEFYITRSATGFSVCSNNAAPANASFGFDYIVLG